MNAGHFGFAAAVKGKAPTVPFWTLVLASQWLEIVFIPLFALGLERIETLPGAELGAYGDLIIYADYSHSLVGALALSVIFGACAAFRYGKKSGCILGLVAFSHWVLDLLVHRSDMPILPGAIGDLPRLGFGLWQYHTLTAAIEFLIVTTGAFMYWQSARKIAGSDMNLIRRANLCSGILLLAGVATLGLNLIGL